MSLTLPCSAKALFDFLSRPRHLLEISPPEFQLEIVQAPERLHLGARITVRGRRWGMPQLLVSEVTAFQQEELIVEVQRTGPLRAFRHERRIDIDAGGVRLFERIEFEPPGGLVGLMVTAEKIEKELGPMMAYRQKRLGEILSKSER
jgi:ligand-binding SRPBCC domain-containing protein